MKVALADDHALFRAGLRCALSDAFGDEIEVVEASDYNGLQTILSGSGDLDLILCDQCMAGMDPDKSIRRLVELRPETPLVVVSASERPLDARRSIQQGARGYIFKSDSLAVLERVLELVLAGGAYAPVSALMASSEPSCRTAPAGGEPGAGEVEKPVQSLSRRQTMIFERLVDGKSNKLIARELGIAEGTVKAQLRTVFRKLGVHNRTQAALFAAQVFGTERRGGGRAADDWAEGDGSQDASPAPRQNADGRVRFTNCPGGSVFPVGRAGLA
ncbi:response regulator transcription factor [Pelagibius sp. CAU 1746]|uniref:response regulator transcription factor n=1 Tax=Pelagibius sp. CAU 1746 TaxID=3140370 RepID=UPI00325A628A